MFPDTFVTVTGDGKFVFGISEDMDGATLASVEAYVTTVSSAGDIEIQIRNVTQAQDMLTTPITIEQGDESSLDAGTQPEIDDANATVLATEQVAIDVDQDGTGSMGLGVILAFA